MKSRTSGSSGSSRTSKSRSNQRRSSSGSSSRQRKRLSPTAKAIGAATAGALVGGLVVAAIARKKKPTIMKTAEKLKDWVQDQTRSSRLKAAATSPALKILIKGIADSASLALEEKDMESRTSGSTSEGSQESGKGPTPQARILSAATVGAIAGGLLGAAIAKSKSPAVRETTRKLKGWSKSATRSPFVKYLIEDAAQVIASQSSTRSGRLGSARRKH